MNHDEAIGARATERYFLSELPVGERDAFEEHYFECTVCADDVRSASAFVGALRASAQPESPFRARQVARARRNFTMPLAMAASVLVALLGWMQLGMVGPLQTAAEEARQPRVLSSYRLESNRGEERPQVPSSRAPFELEVLVPPDGGPNYACLIIDAQGVTRYTLPVTAAQAQDYVQIEIPGGVLHPGNYTLRVDGRKPKIAEYPFTVR